MISRTLFALLSSALLLAACSDSPDTPAPASETRQAQDAGKSADSVPEYTIEQFMDTEQIGGASFSPDGSRVAFSSNRSGVCNVYAKPVEGGEALALTESTTDPRFLQTWFPEDDGHGFRNRDNEIEGYRAIRQFLDTHLAQSSPRQRRLKP